jgi:hypothetical protein
LRLLLDEHYPPEIAQQLRLRFGHDVVAVAERSELRSKLDDELLEIARLEQRALVTENLRHFARLARHAFVEEREHFGLVLVSPRRFRHAGSGLGALVAALDTLLRRYPGAEALVNRVVWLEPA